MNSHEVRFADLQDALLKEERRTKSLENEVKSLTAECMETRSKAAEMETSNKQLRTLAEGLERIREELLDRLQSRNSERVAEEEQSIRGQREVQ